VKEIQVKSILNKKKKRDSWFLDEYTVNPYEGCSFNCLYCYVRGSKYGENMEEGLNIKSNAIEILDKQLSLRARKEQYGIIALASATDPYIALEEEYKLTQGFLKLILKHKFPVLVITKSKLILRDLAILREISSAARLPADLSASLKVGSIVSFSISTLDESIAKKLEPGAPSPIERLETMQQCHEAGLLTGLNCIPTLPFISDSEDQIEDMIMAAKKYKADYILVGGLTLFGDKPADSKMLYYRFLERNFPHHIPSYKKLYGTYSMPPKYYTDKLSSTVKRLCQGYNIRNAILDESID